MPTLRFEAMNAAGEAEAAEIEAANADEAIQMLRARGLFVTTLNMVNEAAVNGVSSKSPERSRRASWDKRPIVISVFIWLFVASLGSISLVAGLRNGISSWRFAARAARTEGTVVRHDNWIPGKGISNESCRAVVVYEADHKSYEVFGPVQFRPHAYGWPKVFPIGSAVPVLYDPDRPENALVE